LPTRQDRADYEDWEYVEKAESNVDFDAPIDEGDDRNEKPGECHPRSSLAVIEKHAVHQS